MEPQSPPKRMTRARAAAKASGDTASSAASTAATRAKASTAAPKAKTARSTATATTASVAAKRKIRSEEAETDNEQDELGFARAQPPVMKPARSVRGRLKKTVTDADAHDTAAEAAAIVAEAAAPATRAHRGRPPKKAAAASAATRATRARKTVHADGDESGDETTGRAAAAATKTAAKSTTTRTRAKSTASATGPTIAVRTAAAIVSAKQAVPKKRVTFEEPEKENIAPKTTTTKTARPSAAASKVSETTTGLRAQPARRAATSAPKAAKAARSTRTASSSSRGKPVGAAEGNEKSVEKQPKPLSPKKVTQVRVARDDVESEDELGAMDSNTVYVKPLLRSPSKPGLGMGVHERAKTLAGAGLDLESASRDIQADSGALIAPEAVSNAILASPARRPPLSPAKDGLMRSPARRLEFNGMAPLDATSSAANPTAYPASLLLSPAKRFPVPMKNTGGSLEDDTRSPSKMSMLQTPAKRPASPVKAAILLQRPDMRPAAVSAMASGLVTSPEPKSTLLAPAPSAASLAVGGTPVQDNDIGDDSDSLAQMLDEMASDAAAMEPDSPTRHKFPGRLSAVVPRETHPAVAGESPPVEATEQDELLDSNSSICEVAVPPEDPMEIDDANADKAPPTATMSPSKSKLAMPRGGAFGLRARDLSDFSVESDSEDEPTTRVPAFSAPALGTVSSTPCPSGKRRNASRTPSSRSSRESIDGRSTAKRLRMSKLGFTPLAEQLNSWKAHSPSKGAGLNEAVAENSSAGSESAVPSTFFEEAMAGHAVSTPRAGGQDSKNNQNSEEQHGLPEVLPPIFDKVSLTLEDLELAEEANDMSLMEQGQMGDMIHLTPSSHDESTSEDSQEYGDENAIPIDPALLGQAQGQSMTASSPAVPPVTPQRSMMHTFHTVSKVPLKPADESTPQPVMRRRSFSVSRLPTARRRSSVAAETNNSGDNVGGTDSGAENSSNSNSACGLTRNATVISYSPTRKDRRRESRRQSRRESFGGEAAVADMVSDEEREIVRSLTNSPAPVTPAKSEGGWSVTATPARTPRRDIDPGVLRGAVVFVDVYTTEGADASGIFVELLTQMGARCVKNWPWSPSSPESDNGNKIGITHVVFKDGGKRTLEKVRESGGVVQCVGVSWVLDCERESQWLDEAPYHVDTSAVPRGGARRRQTMEPMALSNMNGMIVTTPVKPTNVPSQYRDCRTAPSTPANRRGNRLWARSQEGSGAGSQEQQHDGTCGLDEDGDAEGSSDWMLAAVPKTPAPEAIARYVATLTPSTPMGDDDDDEDDEDDDDSVMSTQHEQSLLITRTCPPKNTCYRELGEGILSREKDEGVLMRLMSARRKSLQFAPKIASPLSKAWN